MAPPLLTFSDIGDFAAMRRAERFLEDAGFSVGHAQRGAPRGILYGDYDIQKWRNLNERHRAALHGVMTGDMRNGPVTVALFPSAPDAARAAMRTATAGYAKRMPVIDTLQDVLSGIAMASFLTAALLWLPVLA